MFIINERNPIGASFSFIHFNASKNNKTTMGIPGFFGWIKRRYPKCVRRSKPKHTKIRRPDALYLDMNALIHPACVGVTTDAQRFNNVEKLVRKIVDHTKPSQLLFLSIDGVAPMAKICHQRNRRFLNAQERKEGEWDTNQITPGTPFMSDLTCYLRGVFQSWRPASEVILSDSGVPGEGEHKILAFMRKHNGRYRQQVIFSPDADLVVLGLTLFQPEVWITRLDHRHPNQFWEFEIDELVSSLHQRFPVLVGHQTPESVVRDWVLLTFLGGNDFVPPVNNTNIGNNELDFWFESYQKYRVWYTTNFTRMDGRLNLNRFQHFLKFCLARNCRKPYPTTTAHIPPQELVKAWYWTLLYYFSGVPSWTYHYKHSHTAPSLKALCTAHWQNPKFRLGAPYQPFEQLLTVLPPSSASSCLPSSFGRVFKSDLKPFCPDKVEVLPRPGRADWDVTVKVPEVPAEMVKACVRKTLPLCSVSDRCRNRNERHVYRWRGPPKKKRRCVNHKNVDHEVSSTVQ